MGSRREKGILKQRYEFSRGLTSKILRKIRESKKHSDDSNEVSGESLEPIQWSMIKKKGKCRQMQVMM